MSAPHGLRGPLFDLHPDPMALVDADGTVVDANRSWLRWQGCVRLLSAEPVAVGESLLDHLRSTPRTDGRRAAGGLEAVLDGGAERRRLTFVDDGGRVCACELEMVVVGVGAERVVSVTVRPVSDEHARAEASERRLRDLTESLDSVIFVSSPHVEEGRRRLHYISASYERIWGRSRESILERPLSFLDVVHPDDRAEVRANLHQQAEGTWDREFRLLRDGEVRWIHSRAFPVHDDDGQVREVVGIATDITARKKAEAALDAHRKELNLVLDRLPVGVVMVRDRDIVYANRAAGGYLGVDDPDQHLGAAVGDILHPADRTWALRNVDRMLAERITLPPREMRVRHQDGSWITVDVAPVRILDLAGGPALLFVVWDVGTQRSLVETLHRTQARFRAIFQASPMGIAVVDFDGGIQDMNPALCRLLDIDADEDFPERAVDILHPSAEAEGMSALQDLSAGRIARHSMETRLRRDDGSWQPVLLHASGIRDSAGTPNLAVVLVEDISERRELEDQLRQSQRIESLGRLAGGIAHDFNNLVTVITGHAEFLLEDLDVDEPLKEDLREIHRAGERAAALTGQLLAFSRRTVMQPRVLNLNRVVDGLSGMLTRTLGEDVHLSVYLADDLARTRVDPVQMEQVIMNLAVNARDAMPRGGVLRLSTFNETLDEDFVRHHLGASAGPHVALQVEDTGVGMDEAIRSHIFEPFFTTKEPGKGTGLGLAMVYGIVKQSGGYIAVESEPGSGTVFTVHLPAVEAALSEGSGAEADRDQGSGKERILLVEDEEGVRSLIQRILESRGYDVVSAPEPLAALELLEHEEPIDLVVTDVVMPGMGGGELVERIRERIPGIRVLFISGYADDEIVRHGVVAGTVPFLQKPFTGSDILHEVRTILDAD